MSIELLLISILVFLASTVGTFSGFGASTIMVPVMLLFFPLPLALLFVGIIHWFGDIWKMLFFRSAVYKWKLIVWFAIPGIIASYIGATISTAAPEQALIRVLGAFLLFYALFVFFNREWKISERNVTAGVSGLVSGLAAGIFGVGGAIRGAFLSAFNFPKEVYLFTSGAMALVIDSARITGYVAGGARLEGLFLWGLLVFVPISLLGAWVAKYFVNRVPQKYFRIFIVLFLAIVAIKFLIFP